ncbi:MAG TPA: hypothetical protein PKL22_10565 [Saprospiraceae bacterium]|nr:hypothetical protein [Saprospiraceae bacterium]
MIKNYFAIYEGRVIDYTMANKGVEYSCPECGKSLRLRGGDLVTNHLYHVDEIGCKGETAIHLAYKEVFKELKKIKLPINPFKVDLLEFDRVELEVTIQDIRPDAIGWIGEYPYFIEFANTSFIGVRKLDKIKSINIPCIEIYIGGAHTINDIKKSLVDSTYNKNIVHYPDIFRVEFELEKLKNENQCLRNVIDNLEKEKERLTTKLNDSVVKINELSGAVEQYKEINNAKVRLSERVSSAGNNYKFGKIDGINFRVFDNTLYINTHEI